ncbi:hypothetical protein MRX96_025875 [Rhipicephalus microplus]
MPEADVAPTHCLLPFWVDRRMLLALVDESDFPRPGRQADGWSLDNSVELLAMAVTRTGHRLLRMLPALMMAGRFIRCVIQRTTWQRWRRRNELTVSMAL